MHNVKRMSKNNANEEMIPGLANQPASGQNHKVGRGRNKNMELGELG